MVNKIINYVVTNFGFKDQNEFLSSLLHQKILLLTLPFAGISAFIETMFGLQTITLLAFVLLITLELITGLVGSTVKGVKIESGKFSRFGLKIFVWLSLIFIINTLKMEYLSHNDVVGAVAYPLLVWLHGTLFIYVNLEYLISVLENLGVIFGKSSSPISEIIKDKLKSFMGDDKKNTKRK